MVSVSIIKGYNIPASAWSIKERKIAIDAAIKALKYVGCDDTDIAKDERITLTIRRLCKEAERSRVIEKYLQPTKEDQ